MSKRFITASVFVLVTIAALACGFTNPPATPIPTATPLPPIAEGTPFKDSPIKNFDHLDLEVESGTVITWVNNDNTQHTVTHFDPEGNPRLFDSKLMAPDVSFRFIMDVEPGEYKYYCKLHPNNMVAIITVKAKSD